MNKFVILSMNKYVIQSTSNNVAPSMKECANKYVIPKLDMEQLLLLKQDMDLNLLLQGMERQSLNAEKNVKMFHDNNAKLFHDNSVIM